MDNTLHWVKDSVYLHVALMHRMSLEDLRNEFDVGSRLNQVTKGVMDVMFVASCFDLPIVAKLGRLFWIFAREIIRIRVSSSDQLNLLLWNRVLPQTVLVLDPIPFFLDAMMEPIDYVVSFQGTIMERTEGMAPDAVPARTVLMVASTSALIFHASARVSILEVQHFDVLGVVQHMYALRFTSVCADDRLIHLQAVFVRNSGCFITGYAKVHANHLSVENATTGLNVKDVGQLYITTTHPPLIDVGFNSKFSYCDVGFSFSGVSSFIGSNLIFSDCCVALDVKMKQIFILEDSRITKCDSLGEILSAPSCIPSFHRNVVTSIDHILALQTF